MKHHFGDFLDRSLGHWSISPNRERWSYHFDDLEDAPNDQAVLTLTKNDQNWRRIFDFVELEELTLHEPSKEQIQSLEKLPGLSRLRITHARPKSLEFLFGLRSLRELVLEYVSGVEQLDPIGALPALEAVHLENLRRVEDFSGILPGDSLRYLAIHGTLDWNQPIRDLEFIGSLVSLEFFELAQIRLLKGPPALSGLARLKKLKRLRIAMNALPIEEFAFVEAACPRVDGAVRPAYVFNEKKRRELPSNDYRALLPESEFLSLRHTGILESGKRYVLEPKSAFLLGKGTRTLNGKPENIIKRCNEHETRYRQLVEQYRNID